MDIQPLSYTETFRGRAKVVEYYSDELWAGVGLDRAPATTNNNCRSENYNENAGCNPDDYGNIHEMPSFTGE